MVVSIDERGGRRGRGRRGGRRGRRRRRRRGGGGGRRGGRRIAFFGRFVFSIAVPVARTVVLLTKSLRKRIQLTIQHVQWFGQMRCCFVAFVQLCNWVTKKILT
jgi:hypothetical protein